MATVAYLRISTDEQKKGFGLDAQLDAIVGEVGDPDVIYRDEGISGASAARPGLLEALEALQEGDILVVAKLDRLARDTFLGCWIEKETEKRGARIHSVAGEGTDSDDPMARLMRDIARSFASYERHLIAGRLAGGREQARKRGRKMGGAVPFGFNLDADGQHLQVNENEQQVIELMRQLRERGQSYRQIGAELERRGVVTKGGKQTWHPQVVKQALTQKNSAQAVRQRVAATA